MSERVTVEVRGLELRTHHGVSEAERDAGQRLLIDIAVVPAQAGATASDKIEETVDYGELCAIASEAATERGYATLERVCGEIARRVHARFSCELVRVRAAKPEPPIDATLGEVAVVVEQAGPAAA